MTHWQSPNHNARPAGLSIDTLVLHYTGMPSAQEALARLCDPQAEVSAHYLVEEDGTVHALVDEARRAWHAGRSVWRGRAGVNDVSIGVEIVNPGHEFGYRPFPAAQMTAVRDLCVGILARHPIPARNVVAHSDIAPGRKEDPGEWFDWPWLAQAGVGLWPAAAPGHGEQARDAFPLRTVTLREGATGPEVAALQQALVTYGYALPLHGVYDAETRQVVVAFQRHFARHRLDGVWDGACAAALTSLLAQVA